MKTSEQFLQDLEKELNMFLKCEGYYYDTGSSKILAERIVNKIRQFQSERKTNENT